MSALPDLYNRARAAVTARGFDAEVQTRIALFLGAAKNINAAIMAAVELHPQITIAYPFVHGQYFRELEFASLLARVTQWSPNPVLYVQGAELVAPLWQEWWRIQVPIGPALDPRAGFTALALGHALLSRLRLAPVIPENADALNPFVAALRRIEQENGRMIQAQIRLLKDAVSPVVPEARERIVEQSQELVDQVFERFLAWLGDLAPPAR